MILWNEQFVHSTIGRKNWLFSDTPKGADASALWYSLIETAKANGHEPFEYILNVLNKISTANSLENYMKLLPFNISNKKIILFFILILYS